MNQTDLQVVQKLIDTHTGFIGWAKFETYDDTPVVIGSLDPDDNSSGFIELRYAAAAYDTGTSSIVGISGVKRAPFVKISGALTLGTITDEYSNPDSGIMTDSDIIMEANGGKMDIEATGAGTTVTWDIITMVNNAITEIIEP